MSVYTLVLPEEALAVSVCVGRSWLTNVSIWPVAEETTGSGEHGTVLPGPPPTTPRPALTITSRR